LISKILVGRKTSEVVENADELSFGEGQVLPFFLSFVEEHFGHEISSQHITAEEYQLRDCLSPQHQF